MARNTPQSNRAAQAAHRERLAQQGLTVLQGIKVDQATVAWLDTVKGRRSRARAIADLLTIYARKREPIPIPPKAD